jgi:hypothetical protein
MESILNWYREEGLIFKGGSGAGLNLSRIRSSKELLSSGGTASGPVSFMRSADASAGTIKSGGATRRAAKMVVLDVDHPDIEEFVQTKLREEEKIRVLRDAGFDMDLGGSDIASVQYQNANNSVRVSDDFMRASESDGQFGLRARMTGEVIESIGANKKLRYNTDMSFILIPPGMKKVASSSVNANGRIQKLQLFMRGSAMSGAPIMIGIIQLARPTKAGMMAPKIMISACMVVSSLNVAGSTSCMPGWNSSARITIAKLPPMKNINRLKHRYSVPMSLWLVVVIHRHSPLGWCSP